MYNKVISSIPELAVPEKSALGGGSVAVPRSWMRKNTGIHCIYTCMDIHVITVDAGC